MHLIQTFAVVREIASANLAAASHLHLQEPVRVCERLAGRAYDIGFIVFENRFALIECRYAA
jgi:hypothetical protein